MTMRRREVFALAVVIVAALAGCGSEPGESGPTATPLPGTVLDPPKDVADFTLTDQRGESFTLSELRGKAVLLFFGYTNCPDVCPTTLSEFKRVKQELGDDADRVAFVFVSVDGARDTPERLAAYVGAFDPSFIGLTGDDVSIRSIAQDYGVFFQRQTYANDANYLVDHTASTFVVGPEGRLRVVIRYGTDPTIVALRVRAVL